MNARQQLLERRTDNIEDCLTRLQVQDITTTSLNIFFFVNIARKKLFIFTFGV